MSPQAEPHDLAERPLLGTPRPLPRVMLCHANADFRCGKYWVANTMEEYEYILKGREAHQTFCRDSGALKRSLILPT